MAKFISPVSPGPILYEDKDNSKQYLEASNLPPLLSIISARYQQIFVAKQYCSSKMFYFAPSTVSIEFNPF